MSNYYTSLPLDAFDDRSVFLEHAWNICRAYRNQALELISICQLLSRIAPPMLSHEDAQLKRLLRVCDLALRSAADSGVKVTEEANARFNEATRILSEHSERMHRLDPLPSIYSKMDIAKRKDSLEKDWSHVEFEEARGPMMIVRFVLLQSPVLSPHDPETVIVSQMLSANPSIPEILWNFSRHYKPEDRARLILEQNPHFYLRCPADESVYTPTFQRRPLQDSSGVLEHNDTVYVLFDRPCRVFLDTELDSKIFGNVWSLNGLLVFRDSAGVLEGEGLVRSCSIRGKLWCCEQPAVYHDTESRSRLDHRRLRPMVATTLNDSPTAGTFEDWTELSRPASHNMSIHMKPDNGSR